MGKAITEPGVRPEVQAAQPLACRLRRKEMTGRRGPIPNAGEVELENRSSEPFEIKYTMTPLQFLNLVVNGPDGAVVSEGHYGDHFSPTLEPLVLRLLPGETFTAPVSLLATVPRERRRPGSYLVQAIYQYNGLHAVSEPVEVTIS
jgi:hypothetical protein